MIKDLEELKRLKSLVSDTQNYNADNIMMHKQCINFIFKESFWGDDKSRLKELGLPTLSANSLEAFINRLCGEFADNHPDIKVEYDSTDDQNKEVLEAYVDKQLRDVLSQYKARDLDNKVIRGMFGGCYYVVKVDYDYDNPETFRQSISVKDVDAPTTCGFDPQAREKHRGDAKYCYQNYQMTSEDLMSQYDVTHDDLNQLIFPTQDSSQFQFSYTKDNGERTKIVNVCEFYEKKFKTFDLLLLSDSSEMRAKDYIAKYGDIEYQEKDEPDEEDEENEGSAELLQEAMQVVQENAQKPKVIEKSKRREVKYIERTLFIGSKVLEKKRTVYKSLPLIFFDGNGFFDGEKYFARSYYHNSIGTQRLKNFVLNQLADSMSNVRKSDILMPEEALPTNQSYLRPYLEPNFRGGVMVYKSKSDTPLPSGFPDPIQPPTVITAAQIPQDFINFLDRTEQMNQNQLGAYDASLGIDNQSMSGKAIVAGSTNSNAAAKPTMINYIASWNQIAKVIVELIPYIKVTPETVPLVINKQTHFIDFNKEGGAKLDYNVYKMKVHMKEGNNFEQTKKDNIELLTKSSQSFPAIGALVNSPEGLPIILQNFDFKGSDKLREIAEKKAEEPPKPAPPNPDMIKAMNESKKIELDQQKFGLEQQRFSFDKEKFQLEYLHTQQKSVQEDRKIDLEEKSDKTAAALEVRRQNIDKESDMRDRHSDNLDRVIEWNKFHKDKAVDLAKTAMSSMLKAKNSSNE